MVALVADLKRRGLIPEQIIFQIGSGDVPQVLPPDVRVVDNLPFGEVREILQRARIVITHGGTGSLITALRAGCNVIAMPRAFALDHEIMRMFQQLGIADEVLALPIEDVREILQMTRLTPMPRTPAFVRGVMNLRGDVVPVIDLAARYVCFADRAIEVPPDNQGLLSGKEDAVFPLLEAAAQMAIAATIPTARDAPRNSKAKAAARRSKPISPGVMHRSKNVWSTHCFVASPTSSIQTLRKRWINLANHSSSSKALSWMA